MELNIFNYNDTAVRTVVVEGEPWFVLADLCKILDLPQVSRVRARLDDALTSSTPIQDSLGRTQNATIVSEAGMYEVVIRSDKPEAAAFRRWITQEVLPEIRKTGGYGNREMDPHELMARAVLEANRTIKALEAKTAEDAPKVAAWDHIVSSAGSWSYNDAAKVLFEQGIANIGEKRLVRQLVEWGYLYRDHKGRPHVYQRFVEQDLFKAKARVYTDQETGETRESSAPQVRVTGKGLDMLFRRFREGQLAVSP